MKIGRLKIILHRQGYIVRQGKGSHCIWVHPRHPEQRIVLAGTNGRDAHPYQIAQVLKGRCSRHAAHCFPR